MGKGSEKRAKADGTEVSPPPRRGGAPRGGAMVHTAWAVGPLAAPFLILACAPRWEMAATAACWSVLILPGLLALNRFFPSGHLLQSGPARFAVASVLGLLLFAGISWSACLLHLRLSTVLVIYAAAYMLVVAGLALGLARKRGPTGRRTVAWWVGQALNPGDAASPDAPDVEEFTPDAGGGSNSRGGALLVIVGIAVMLIGVWRATVASPSTAAARGAMAARESWWIGSLMASGGAVLAGIGVCLGRRLANLRFGAPDKPERGDASASQTAVRGEAESGSWAVGLLWLIALGLALFVMKAAYALPQADFRRDVWNSDDVTYVAEAVDYRYGVPLGRFEPTLGAGLPMSSVNLSPLIAPLTAAISRVTGVECAALHHSVLCPLIVLLGASAMAGALGVVFGGRRWAVPLGLIAVMMVICKSWDYERSMVEFTVWRAMQSKSVHLWLIHPLQLATLILLAMQPSARHLGLAAAVAIVGHTVHPFSTVLGAAWCATAVGVEVVGWVARTIGKRSGGAGSRSALGMAVALTAAYALLGGAYKAQGWILRLEQASPEAGLSTGRVVGEPEESRDLVRMNDRPIPRQEPLMLFGYDVVFNFGAVALPLVLAVGLRRREWLYVAVLGIVALAVCNSAALGRIVSVALPVPILWRARWILPALVCIAFVAVVLFDAVCTLFPRRRAGGTIGSAAALLAVGGAFAGLLAGTQTRLIKIGPAPKQLTKFSADMHGLVDLLGGIEAAPFVWGTREVTRELPQLMPHLKLVLSREKIMLRAPDPRFRDIVLHVRESFRRYRLTEGEFRKLLELYPVDHIVTETLSRQSDPAVGLLRGAGWQEIGRSGRYSVWRGVDEP